jgi:hypothetical protein
MFEGIDTNLKTLKILRLRLKNFQAPKPGLGGKLRRPIAKQRFLVSCNNNGGIKCLTNKNSVGNSTFKRGRKN